jgi:hypothetical protein
LEVEHLGQYFRIVNLDKKEWIEPDGCKLWEICANNSIRMLGYLCATDNWDGTSLVKFFFSEEELKKWEEYFRAQGFKFKVISITHEEDGRCHGYGIPEVKYLGHWCGDRIAVIGDYADQADNVKPDFPTWEELEESGEWKNITDDVAREFNVFVEEDRLKVGRIKNISPDMVITSNGVEDNPKYVR